MLTWARNKDLTTSSFNRRIHEIKSTKGLQAGFKKWECPFVSFWLQQFAKKLNRKLKVMDFGCGMVGKKISCVNEKKIDC